MKRYIVSGSILLALSLACEEKKKMVRRPAQPAVMHTEVTSSPEINLPSITEAPETPPKTEIAPVAKPEIAKVEVPKAEIPRAEVPKREVAKVEASGTMTLAAKSAPVAVPVVPVRYEDTTSRDLAEGSANEVKDEGLARIREKALMRARELEVEDEAKAEAEKSAAAAAEALAQAESRASEAEGSEDQGNRVAMVEPSAPASEVSIDDSLSLPAELPVEEPVIVKKGLDRKTAKALEIRFRKALTTVKTGKIESAKNDFLTLCQAGHAHACHKFAWYEEQAGNQGNATRFYRAACDNGLGKSCNNLAFQFEQKKNYDEALSFYSKACLENHLASCKSLQRVREEQKIDGLQTR